MPETRFRKGDRVEFTFGIRIVQGTVIEDRGPIGVGGRRLYSVQFHPESQSPVASLVELPASELRPAHDALVAK